MSSLFYVRHLDGEDYPYWIGVRTTKAMLGIKGELMRNYLHLTEEDLESWCEHESLRGYHFELIHDSFNGTHMRFMFLSRVDAFKFLLLHEFGNPSLK